MEETLASFVQKTRDNLGMSAKGLAQRANIDLSVIEDIESGKDLFLPFYFFNWTKCNNIIILVFKYIYILT